MVTTRIEENKTKSKHVADRTLAVIREPKACSGSERSPVTVPIFTFGKKSGRVKRRSVRDENPRAFVSKSKNIFY